MPIVAVCGQCSKRYTLDDKFAGRKVKCRTCNSQFVVPAEDATVVADPGAAAPPDPPPDDDVLEMKTEFRKRASMPTITEERPEDEGGGGDEGKRERGGTRSLERKRGSRYRKKSRWKWKAFATLVLLAGAAIGAGVIFVPKNMARKWERTKAFWGSDFVGYLGEIFSVDMALERAGTPEPEAAPDQPAGPPAGTAVVLRGRITAVQPGVAGGDPTACTVTTAEGPTYRLMLPAPSARLAEIAAALAGGTPGPAVAVKGALAANGLDGNKLTQVDVAELTEAEPAAIDGKPGLEVEGAAAAPAGETPPADGGPPAEPAEGGEGEAPAGGE